MARHTETRKKIIEVAKALFARDGYAAVSMEDIARGVGVRKASLYYFYKSKEHVYADILAETIEHAKACMARCFAAGAKGACPSLSELIFRHITASLKDGMTVSMVDIRSLGKSSPACKRITANVRELQKMVHTMLKQRGVSSPHLACQVLMNAVHAYVLHAEHGMTLAPPRTYSRYLASLFSKK
jgi:AcrR family transcriptional regulator